MSFRFRKIGPRLAAVALLGAVLIHPAMPRAETAGWAGAYLAAEHASRSGDVDAAADFYMQALAADPDNPALLERAVLNAVAAGQLASAITTAHHLAEVRPGHQMAALILAADALKRDEPAAVKALFAGEAEATGRFLSDLLIAWGTFGTGDHEGARAALAALEADQSVGVAGQMLAAYHQGLLEAALGNDQAANEALLRAEEYGGKGNLRFTRVRAGVLARLGRVEEARALIRDRLGATVGNKRIEALDREIEAAEEPIPLVTTAEEGAAEAFFGIAGFLARGQAQVVGLAYARIATYLDPDLIDAKLLLAQTLLASEQFDLAVAAFEAVPRDVPEALEALIGRAEAMYEAGRVEPAIVAMREVAARYPRSMEAQNALGDMLRREERFQEAAVAYDASIKLIDEVETAHWVLFYQRGISYERSKQWDLAESDFRRALDLEPDQPLVLNYLGYSWVEMGRNLDEAQRMIEKAVEQRPQDGFIVDSLGWVLYRLGDFNGAVEHLGKAVELQPVDPVINDHFGDALWMVGRRTEARFQWRRALSFKPEEAALERIRRKLDVGLDTVLAEEAAAGKPAIFGASETRSGG